MRDVPRDMQAIGVVVVRGDNVMDGYYMEPEATAAVMSGDWLHTGDMAVWDDENYIHIVDNKKDIIISGGEEHLILIEVEKAIYAHPAVLECAVFAAPDPKWGEGARRGGGAQAREAPRSGRASGVSLAHPPGRIQGPAHCGIHHGAFAEDRHRQNSQTPVARELLGGQAGA